MKSGRPWALAFMTLAVAGTLACNPQGNVVDKRANCHKTSSKNEICDWQLKTTKWFSVAKHTYDKCRVGEHYPECGN